MTRYTMFSRREREDFERRREQEMARVVKLEEVTKEENRRLQRDRKLFEQHASAARAIPDKKEREEIQVRERDLLTHSNTLSQSLSAAVSLSLSRSLSLRSSQN